jgi:hypothetical protein
VNTDRARRTAKMRDRPGANNDGTLRLDHHSPCGLRWTSSSARLGILPATRLVTPYACEMSLAGEPGSHELVVADDGSIPAEQLRSLGLPPGAHLRVVEEHQESPSSSLAGSLPDFPDLSWEDFERSSEAARQDAATSCG